MKFTAKDLMVSVSPAQAARFCALHTTICFNPTIHCFNHSCGFVTCAISCRYISTNCFDCSIAISQIPGGPGCGFQISCGPGNSACDPTKITCPGTWIEIGDPADLVTLREELTTVLKQLDTFEKEGLPGQLRTKADADEAEAALTSALEQVRAQRKNLK